ncbi:MAG: cysteine--tRNA ligase [Anaerolineae bacterium UTCFX2]|jgi:cysteinyl-tRNA synthetase|nr:cysteine--tRNA ligase [Anaerolineales bacterium]OQY93154.1 MAG: cysteine--tRNA ligase [Anaerolineae bacterium UTCFX2]
MTDLRLFDTYTRSVRAFKPLEDNQVRLYACGLTVYDYAHIGNLRTYIFEDLLRRTLEFNGYTVNHVMNITDVGHLVSDADTGEDKMEKSAQKMGKTAWEIAEYYTQAFIQDFARLNIKMPTVLCRATDHIQEQIDFIRCIEKNGYTYATSDGIYFDTSRLSDYGYLARLDVEGLQAGSRIELGEKKHPTDFALWKFSPKDQQRQMEWDSPWGKGFPGWHIECSAMSVKYLGSFFDIHCGGEDHIPVHHTNEIAQTEACYATHLANFWMHGYFLQLDEAKMAKSAGGFIRLQTLIDKGYDPLAYRFFTMNALYRAKLNFTWEGLDAAAKSFDRLRLMAYRWGAPGSVDEGFVDQFREQINDDLNFPRALAVTWELTRSALPDSTKKATLLVFDQVLGLGLADWQPPEQVIPDEILALAESRTKMRQEKRWAEADALRDQIIAAGYEIEDTPQGPRIKSR